MSMVRAIIFDLYGVLGLNGWQDFKQRHFGGKPELWQQLRSLGQAVDARQASYQNLVAEIARASQTSEQEVRLQLEVTKPNTELLDFIQSDLSEYKIGVLSNANTDVMTGIFSPEQLTFFDDVVLSFNTGLTKPDETMFLLSCERLSVRPEQCVFIDDKQSNIDAAEAIAMHGVLYKTVAQTKEAVLQVLGRD